MYALKPSFFKNILLFAFIFCLVDVVAKEENRNLQTSSNLS